jgi:uncharacterized protein
MTRVNRVLARRAAIVATVAAASVLQATAAAARDFLWKISAKQGVIYLVGSVHVLTKDYYPLSAGLETAFKDCDVLVEETDIGELWSSDSQLQILTKGMLPAGQSLDKVVSASTYAQVTKRLANLGMPVEPLKQLKPWMLALTLLQFEWQKAGFDPNLGLDKHFYDRAHSEGKSTQGLETAEYQISLLDGLTAEQQDRMLADTLKDLDTEIANFDKLVSAWKGGDAATVERITLADLKQDPVIYRRLLIDRNRNWLPKLEALFSRPGHAFVVVGAAHLIGPDGLLAMLKAKGYSVEQQ